MINKNQAERAEARAAAGSQLQLTLFWICLSLLAVVPLAFTTIVYRAITLPKFLALLVGSSVILFMLAMVAANDSSRKTLGALKSKQVALVAFYLLAITAATFSGVAPLASLFGSHQNEMGLITRSCFFICFIGLIVGIGYSPKRLLVTLWTIVFIGLIVAVYAFAQFVGRDPFLPVASYTFNSPSGPVMRVTGTLGHANYLGNFLLYTTPVAAALAIVSRGRARRLALIPVGLSIAAILFSGTRGAWLGLLAGAVTFAAFEVRRGKPKPEPVKSYLRRGTVIPIVIVLVSAFVIITSPASRNIGVRARSITADRFTGSGRILLWRDAVRMVPRYALLGCGPEGFSKAFLAYKSKELAIHAPQINNESSHNSYLDAYICFGLPGAVAYVAILIAAFSILLKSRRRALDRHTRLIITGLLSSLAAVSVHNVFIYDQIPTGLYFFAFMALSVIVYNVTEVKDTVRRDRRNSRQRRSAIYRWSARAIAVVSLSLVAVTVWFSLSLVESDTAIKQAFDSFTANDFDGLVANGECATRGADPTGAYNFLFARALSLYAEAIPRDDKTSESSNSTGASPSALRARAIAMATTNAEKALMHTLTPESLCVLLAYLALLDGDPERLHQFADEAIRWDPNFFNARWLLAEALLAEGDRDGAAREARLAFQLRPGHSQAVSVLVRARGEQQFVSPRTHGLIERARSLVERGNTTKAIGLLIKAIQVSNGPCPTCHRELAILYENTGEDELAIEEWQEFAREVPDEAAAEQVSARIEALKHR